MTQHMDNLRIMHWLTLDGYSGVPAVGPSGKADIYYNQSTGKLMMGKDGGAFSELPALSNAAFNNVLGVPSFTVGAKVSTTITVTVQLKDINGVNVGSSFFLRVWISDAAGGVITGTGPNGTVAIGNASGTIIETVTTKKVYTIATGATGEFQLAMTDSGTPSWYLNVACADGKIYSSAVINFT